MTHVQCMDALCLAGRIILENGGETSRAEDTLQRMARAMGMTEPEIFAIPSGLFMAFTDETNERRSNVLRVRSRGAHLQRVDRVNSISRDLASGKITSGEVIGKLNEAAHLGDGIPAWYAPLAAMLSAMGFAAMFGGNWVDILAGGIAAAMTQWQPIRLPFGQHNTMISVLIGGMLCEIIPLLGCGLTGLGHTHIATAAALMPLVPGISMTNGVRDLMGGDLISGVVHISTAVLICAMLTGGTLVSSSIFRLCGGVAIEAAALELPFWINLLIIAVGSWAAGTYFGILLQVGRKGSIWGGLIGMVSYVLYWLCMRLGLNESMSMFIGTLFGAILCQVAARHKFGIATIFLLPTIIPMLPGFGLYNAVHTLARGDAIAGIASATHAMALILMIVLGLVCGSALPEMISQHNTKEQIRR